MTAEDTGVYELRRKKKAVANSRVLSVYFKTWRDLAKARRAAKSLGIPLATFIRDSALERAAKVCA